MGVTERQKIQKYNISTYTRKTTKGDAVLIGFNGCARQYKLYCNGTMKFNNINPLLPDCRNRGSVAVNNFVFRKEIILEKKSTSL